MKGMMDGKDTCHQTWAVNKLRYSPRNGYIYVVRLSMLAWPLGFYIFLYSLIWCNFSDVIQLLSVISAFSAMHIVCPGRKAFSVVFVNNVWCDSFLWLLHFNWAWLPQRLQLSLKQEIWSHHSSFAWRTLAASVIQVSFQNYITCF